MIRVVEHETKGYVWQDDDTGRQVRVTYLPKSQARLMMLEGKGAAAKPAGEYKGGREDAQCIAMAWLHGMTPGSNKITWVREPSGQSKGFRKAS